MSVINQIKAEIERQIALLPTVGYSTQVAGDYIPVQNALNYLLSFLDTLEEKSEKPTNLDDLLDDYFEKLVVPEHQIIFEDTYRKIATDFYEFCETRMKEQMMKDYIPKETAKKIARGSLGVQDFIRKIDKYEEDKQ